MSKCGTGLVLRSDLLKSGILRAYHPVLGKVIDRLSVAEMLVIPSVLIVPGRHLCRLLAAHHGWLADFCLVG